MNTRFAFFLVFAALSSSQAYSQGAWAQTFISGNPSNRIVEIPLSASMANGKVVVTVIGKNADSQNLSIALEGPAGLKLSVKSMTINTAAQARSAYLKSGVPTKLYGSLGATQQGGDNRLAAEGRDPNCGCLLESQIQQLLAIFGGGVPRQTLCAAYPRRVSCDSTNGNGGGNTGGDGSGGSQNAYATAFLESNRCLAGGKPAAAIELDLTGVAAADLTGSIKLKTKLSMYSGNRRASIKPRSDGGIFPGQALLLVSPVGGENSGVRLAKFSGARRTSSQTLAVPSVGGSIYYRGNVYRRFPISKYMRGGKGVFQVTGSGQGYAICAKLARTRQNFNGYTN